MAYATVSDVQARMLRTLSTDEEALCGTFLDDVAVMIDGTNTSATADVKKVVSKVDNNLSLEQQIKEALKLLLK